MSAFNSPSLIRSLPLYGGIGAGALAALAFVAMPAAMLESLVWNSGVAALLPVAAPPLGVTARALLALGSGVLAAAVIWAVLYLLVGPGGFLVGPARAAGVPVVRRADAHPDAPPRRPMSAADLGLPLMDVVMPGAAERTIPADLDLPLAAFDPAALPHVPMEPARPVAPLAAPRALPQPAADAPGRIETFELTPMVRPHRPAPAPANPPTIETLLKRLENGAGRRARAAAR